MRDLSGEIAETALTTGAGEMSANPTVRVRVVSVDQDTPQDNALGWLYKVEFTTGPRTGQLTWRYADELHVLSAVDLLGELVGE